jgi:hypothetical protein
VASHPFLLFGSFALVYIIVCLYLDYTMSVALGSSCRRDDTPELDRLCRSVEGEVPHIEADTRTFFVDVEKGTLDSLCASRGSCLSQRLTRSTSADALIKEGYSRDTEQAHHALLFGVER